MLSGRVRPLIHKVGVKKKSQLMMDGEVIGIVDGENVTLMRQRDTVRLGKNMVTRRLG